MRQTLFGEAAEDDFAQIRVNEDYARRFEHNKRREELHRLQEKHPEVAARLARQAAAEAAKQARKASADDEPSSEGNTLEESSSSDEEEDESLQDDTDKVLETLVRIKKHDPALYQPDTVVFSQQQSDEEEEAAAAAAAAKGSKGSSKPVYLRTVLANQALEQANGDADATASGPVSGSYASEQAALKAAFLAAADEVKAALQDETGLVSKKPAAAAADQAGDEQTEQKDVNKLLSEYFGPDDAALDPADAFLKSYLANKAWKQPVNGSSGGKKRLQDFGPDDSSSEDEDEGDDVSDEEDEQFLEQVDKFEAAYNFRYEEPGAAQIQSFPRVIGDSVRRKDDRRKRTRDAKAARIAEEKAAREAELRRLKNLKKDEIQDMLSRIQHEAGLKDDADDVADAALAELLEGDFDPEEYDRRMAAAFNDDYYQGSDDADELFGEGEEELANEQDLEQPAVAAATNTSEAQQQLAAAEGFAALRQKQKEQQQQQDEKAAAVAEQRGQLQRMLEDYYKLDYEDNIGGLPCRFRYRQVDAESFGLSTDDILSLSEKQLNSVVGLKMLAPYRDGYKKVRPNYKALQELKGEAAAAAARRQQQKEKKRKRQQQAGDAGTEQQALPMADGQQQQQQQQQQQEVVVKKQKHSKHHQQRQQQDHGNAAGPQHQQQQKPKKKKQQQSDQQQEPSAQDKQAARLASYAKLSLKPTKEQQHQQQRHSSSSSKHAKKKQKIDKGADQQQEKPQQQPGRLANVALNAPLTKAQKKNLLRTLKRQEKKQGQAQ